MKPHFLLAAFLLLLLSLFSCKKDDDAAKPTEPSAQTNLVGTWQLKKILKKEHNSFSPITETLELYEADGPILNFGTQGELEEGYFAFGKFKADASGTYQINGQNLTFSILNASFLFSGTPYIDTLTANHLSFTDTIYYSNNKQNYTFLSMDAYR